MKKGCLILLFSLLFSSVAFADQNDLDMVSFEVPQSWQQMIEEAPISAQEFQNMSLSEIIKFFQDQIKDTVKAPLRLAGKLMAVLILSGILKSLCSEKTLSSLGTSFDMIVAITVFLVCSPLLIQLMQQLKSNLDDCQTYLAIFIPVFTTAMVSCGQAGTAAIYGGLFLGLANLLAAILCNIGIPLLQVLLVLSASGIVKTPVDFFALTKGLSKWCRWLLTLCATIFGTLLTLQSVFAQSADSLALKTGKFLLSSSIPVVGKAVSDAMGSVLAGVKLLKGSLGFAAVLIIALMFLPLIFQCVFCQIIFGVGDIVSGATGNDSCAKLFRSLSDCVNLHLAMVIFFSFIVVSTTVLMILLGSGGA
ncbi:hypothetical protein [uncultured Ruthenibacterium sp.]|uniref:stage III sporulation protein AE n=1 Tax=uncultured Ruthenibacterium sp. TaxID=1905347 RepID=UPI00349EB87E